MTGRTRVSRTTTPPTSFGATLRRMRLERGLRQRDLAGDDISPSYISFLESGRRAPTERVLRHLARRLGCDVTDLRPAPKPEDSLSEEVRVELRLARLALVVGHLTEAERRFRQIAADHRGQPQVNRETGFGLAQVWELTGRHRQAAEAYQQCLVDASQHRLACAVGAVRCLARLDDPAAALQAARRAQDELADAGLGISDLAVEIHALTATIHCETREPAAARQAIETAIRMLPQINDPDRLTEIYWRASLAAHRAGKPARALELAERVAVAGADESRARTAAVLRMAEGGLLLRQEAPDPAGAHSALTEALDRFRRAGNPPEMLRCRLDLARALVMLGRCDEADALAEEIANHPATPPGERVQARLLGAASRLRAGDTAAARDACRTASHELEAIADSTGLPRLWTELGELLSRAGDAQGAVRAYRRATQGLGFEPLLGRFAG